MRAIRVGNENRMTADTGLSPFGQAAGAGSFWEKSRFADRRPLLLARNRIKAALRAWFEAEGFIEVEPALLQISPGNEIHLHAFATQAEDENGAQSPLYLHTSPEFAMKKLLAAGEEKIFCFAPVFRNREQASSALHAREFCMLEWYRAGDAFAAIQADCLALVRAAAQAIGQAELNWRGKSCDAGAPAQHLSVCEAFLRLAKIDLLACLDAAGEGDAPALHAAAHKAGLGRSGPANWSDLFSAILVDRIEPHLGTPAFTLLEHYPAPEAALAQRLPEDPRLAQRFELYACGVELANGFGELTDPIEQRARFQAAMAQKQTLYGQAYPIDEDFLAALALMGPAAGCALGFDRLVMLALGAPRITDVQWHPAQTAP